jgi:hypothetical protein
VPNVTQGCSRFSLIISKGCSGRAGGEVRKCVWVLYTCKAWESLFPHSMVELGVGPGGGIGRHTRFRGERASIAGSSPVPGTIYLPVGFRSGGFLR